MPRLRKSLQTIFIETFTFISLFALLGHFSVNFWERYMIESELTKMKISLHSLKETINDIGDAYDHLHKELRVLVDFAEYKIESEILVSQLLPDEKCEPLTKDKSTIDKIPLHDVDVQVANVNYVNRKVLVKPNTLNESTQKNFINPPSANVGMLTKTLKEDIRKTEDATVEAVPTFTAKNVQKIMYDKALSGKNASTITRNPLISTGTSMNKEDKDRKLQDLCRTYCQYRDPHNHNICRENFDRQQVWRF